MSYTTTFVYILLHFVHWCSWYGCLNENISDFYSILLVTVFFFICTVGSQSKWYFWIHTDRNFNATNFDIEISVLPTLTPSWRLKNCFFTMEIFSQHHLYVNNMRAKFQGQKIQKKKRYSKSINMCSCEMFFNATHFDTLLRIEYFFFAMKFLAWDCLYADKVCSKFQVQKIYTKKDIRNLPTCIVVRMIFSALDIMSFCGSKFLRDVKNHSYNYKYW